MVFIGIIVALMVCIGVIRVCGGVVKKALEIVSILVRLGLGGVISMLIYRAVGGDFSKDLQAFLIVLVGAILIFALICLLASHFRMIGYSINFFTNSILIGLLVTALENTVSVSMLVLAAALFFVPRIMWLSDRKATTSEYCGSDYDGFLNVKTYFYNTKSVDYWEDSGDAWKWLPFQLTLCALFYLVGSSTLLSFFPIQSEALEITFLLAATALNILFDLFIFRTVEAWFCN